MVMFLLLAAVVLLVSIPVYVLFRQSSYDGVPSVRPGHYVSTRLFRALFSDPGLILVAMTNVRAIYGRVFQLWLGPNHTIVTSEPADIAHILANTQDFKRTKGARITFHRLFPNSLFDLTDTLHRIARRQLRDTFNHSHLKGFYQHMQDAISETVTYLQDLTNNLKTNDFSPTIDVTMLLGTVTFRVINNVAIGANWDVEARKTISEETNTLLNGILAEVVGHPLNQYLHPKEHRLFYQVHRKKTLGRYEALVLDRISETREQAANRPRDLLDAILNFSDVDKESATSHLCVFAMAGAHTVNHTLIWALYELCQHPEIVYRIHDEIDAVTQTYDSDTPLSFDDVNKLNYTRKVWKETLRLHAPGSFFLRETAQDVTLKGSGVRLKKGTQVMAFSHGAHTDDRSWNNPLTFDPDRWGSAEQPREGDLVPPGAYAPFSVGPANCAGQFFANFEGVLVLAELLRKFQFHMDCPPENVVPYVSWVLVSRVSSKGDGVLDTNIPFRVKCR